MQGRPRVAMPLCHRKTLKIWGSVLECVYCIGRVWLEADIFLERPERNSVCQTVIDGVSDRASGDPAFPGLMVAQDVRKLCSLVAPAAHPGASGSCMPPLLAMELCG